MESRLYTDVDVGCHSVMLKGFPKNIPRRQLEETVQKLFESMCQSDGFKMPDNQSFVVKVASTSYLKNCQDLYKKLEFQSMCHGKLINSDEQIKASDLTEKERKMVTVKTGPFCCGTKTEEDAIEYYSANVDKLTH